MPAAQATVPIRPIRAVTGTSPRLHSFARATFADRAKAVLTAVAFFTTCLLRTSDARADDLVDAAVRYLEEGDNWNITTYVGDTMANDANPFTARSGRWVQSQSPGALQFTYGPVPHGYFGNTFIRDIVEYPAWVHINLEALEIEGTSLAGEIIQTASHEIVHVKAARSFERWARGAGYSEQEIDLMLWRKWHYTRVEEAVAQRRGYIAGGYLRATSRANALDRINVYATIRPTAGSSMKSWWSRLPKPGEVLNVPAGYHPLGATTPPTIAFARRAPESAAKSGLARQVTATRFAPLVRGGARVVSVAAYAGDLAQVGVAAWEEYLSAAPIAGRAEQAFGNVILPLVSWGGNPHLQGEYPLPVGPSFRFQLPRPSGEMEAAFAGLPDERIPRHILDTAERMRRGREGKR